MDIEERMSRYTELSYDEQKELSREIAEHLAKRYGLEPFEEKVMEGHVQKGYKKGDAPWYETLCFYAYADIYMPTVMVSFQKKVDHCMMKASTRVEFATLEQAYNFMEKFLRLKEVKE